MISHQRREYHISFVHLERVKLTAFTYPLNVFASFFVIIFSLFLSEFLAALTAGRWGRVIGWLWRASIHCYPAFILPFYQRWARGLSSSFLCGLSGVYWDRGFLIFWYLHYATITMLPMLIILRKQQTDIRVARCRGGEKERKKGTEEFMRELLTRAEKWKPTTTGRANRKHIFCFCLCNFRMDIYQAASESKKSW